MPPILTCSKPCGSSIAAHSKLVLWLGLGISLALFPTPAWANGGSALLWTGWIHLFVGNAVIAYLEAGLLSWWFGAPRGRSFLVLLGANYASAWAAALLLTGRFSQYPAITIETVRVWLAIAALLSFLLTLAIEYPFFWLLLRPHKRPRLTALKATLLIHGISYLLLFGWYSLSSQTTLLTQTRVVPAAQIQPRLPFTLSYLSPDGTQTWQLALGEPEPVAIDRTAFEALVPDPQPNVGPVPKLTAASDWDYYTRVFSAAGLTGYNRQTQARQHFALETPFAFWPISHATHLPGDWLIFQLGRDQICLLHPDTQRLALIARGQRPVATLSGPIE